MSYATVQHLIDAMGQAAVDQREETLGPGAAAKALTAATAEIDSYLCTRYAVPVPASDNMARIAGQIAQYRLLGDAADDRSRQDYEDAIRWLKDVQAGRAAIPNAPAQASGVNQAELAQLINGRPSVFGGGLR